MSSSCNPFGKACEEYSGDSANEIIARDKKIGKDRKISKDRKLISEYRIVNKSHHYFVKIKVDDCLIKKESGSRKCDFLFLDCTSNKAFFVELKGQDLGDAIEQIKATIPQLHPQLSQFSYCCRIVQSKVIGATQQNKKVALIQFLKSSYPLNSRNTKDLVRIGSQKLIDQI